MKGRPDRRQKATTISLPAPTGGLNARDGLANMPPTDAIIMDNFFPLPGYVTLRNGSVAWATGLPGATNTLMYYSSATAQKLFAASGSGIYDVSTSGAVGAPVVTAQMSTQWQHANFGAGGGQYLVAVNGADSMQLYNGTSWQAVTGVSSPFAITGVTTSNLVHVNVYKNRLWFVQNSSFKVWYLPVLSVGGAASSVDLAPLFKLGGYLMAMATYTLDDRNGIDDYAIFISSEGEIAMYKGDDPSSASSWALVGVFRIGRPMGRRCFLRVGEELGIICADGLIPMSQFMVKERSQRSDALTYQITDLIAADTSTYANNFGWQITLYPIGNKLLLNVPAGVNQYQYVLNTITGKWCRFTGWAANCFEIYKDSLFYGDNYGTVYQCDYGNTDNGRAISAQVKQAFNYFGQRGQQKRFTMARPLITSRPDAVFAMAMNVDYEDAPPTSIPTYTGNGSGWNVSPWNISPWDGFLRILRKWQSISGVGFAGAFRLSVNVNNVLFRWHSTDIVFEPGGVL